MQRLSKSEVARIRELKGKGTTYPQLCRKFPHASERTLYQAIHGRGAYADFESLADWPESPDPYMRWCYKCGQFRRLCYFYLLTSGTFQRRCKFCICADQKRRYKEMKNEQTATA